MGGAYAGTLLHTFSCCFSLFCFLLTFPNSPFLFPISFYFLPFEIQYHPIHFMRYTLTLRTVQWVRFLYRNEYKEVLPAEGWQWSGQSWLPTDISISLLMLRSAEKQGVSSYRSWCAQEPWRGNKLKNVCVSCSLLPSPLPLFILFFLRCSLTLFLRLALSLVLKWSSCFIQPSEQLEP